ncbi:hypothetical protein [Massilia sp. Dwa41.01b]|uniref:hypothetical protein n=1 Tax=Massilia sp. Dwa41.01b TaxID=2709302 RepID=UPI0035A6F1E3
MTPLWIVVLMKELLEALRDRRTLGMLLMLTLVYPAVIGLILKNMIARGSPDAKAGIELVVIGGGQAPNLLAQLREKKVLVSERGPMMAADIKTLLREKKAAGVLRLGAEFTGYYAELRPAPIELWFDSSIERREQRLEVENILRDYANGIAGARLEARGVSPVVLSPCGWNATIPAATAALPAAASAPCWACSSCRYSCSACRWPSTAPPANASAVRSRC